MNGSTKYVFSIVTDSQVSAATLLPFENNRRLCLILGLIPCKKIAFNFFLRIKCKKYTRCQDIFSNPKTNYAAFD
jgi:hypothetical protein